MKKTNSPVIGVVVLVVVVVIVVVGVVVLVVVVLVVVVGVVELVAVVVVEPIGFGARSSSTMFSTSSSSSFLVAEQSTLLEEMFITSLAILEASVFPHMISPRERFLMLTFVFVGRPLVKGRSLVNGCVKKNLSPLDNFSNCWPMMQANVGPTNPSSVAFSLSPPTKGSICPTSE